MTGGEQGAEPVVAGEELRGGRDLFHGHGQQEGCRRPVAQLAELVVAQHSTLPVESKAQKLSPLRSPTTAAALLIPRARTGTSELVIVPLPSWPKPL